MVNRNQVRCRSCGEVLTIRVTVAGGLQPFVFPCPYCTSQLRGTFYAEQPTEPPGSEVTFPLFELKSEDFEILEFDESRETAGMFAVEVNTELPVHMSLLCRPVIEVGPTSFLLLMRATAMSDEAVAVVDRVNHLRQLRFRLLPFVRRAAAFVAAGDMDRAGQEIRQMPGYAEGGLADVDPRTTVTRTLKACLHQLGGDERSENATEELRKNLELAIARDQTAPKRFIEELNSRLLPEHRRGLLETTVRTLELNDALVPGMWAEVLPESDADEYRVQRSDFAEIKTRYQEIFELAARTIVLPAMVVNFLHRDDPREYSDGKRRSPRDALAAKAQIREGWLDELPATKSLYGNAARRSRNLIGHHLISYDYEKATLIDDRGQETNYLVFLRDYLEIARLLPYLLDVVDFLTDVEQFGASASQSG